jgi:hypothetical protein
MCASFSDGCGLRHSDSSSWIQVSSGSISARCSASAATGGASWAYLNVEVLVDLDGIAKDVDVLGQVGKLPHVAQLLQRAGLRDCIARVHVARGALACGHVEGACRGRRVRLACRYEGVCRCKRRGGRARSEDCSRGRTRDSGGGRRARRGEGGRVEVVIQGQGLGAKMRRIRGGPKGARLECTSPSLLGRCYALRATRYTLHAAPSRHGSAGSPTHDLDGLRRWTVRQGLVPGGQHPIPQQGNHMGSYKFAATSHLSTERRAQSAESMASASTELTVHQCVRECTSAGRRRAAVAVAVAVAELKLADRTGASASRGSVSRRRRRCETQRRGDAETQRRSAAEAQLEQHVLGSKARPCRCCTRASWQR